MILVYLDIAFVLLNILFCPRFSADISATVLSLLLMQYVDGKLSDVAVC